MLKLILGLFISLSFSSCFQLFEDPSTTFVKELTSPDKMKKAVLLRNDGNATVDLSWRVSILSSDFKLSGKELGNTFIVDRNHGATGFSSSSINFKWISNDTLRIEYDKKLRTFKQEKVVEGVYVIYEAR
jgi:hypothetical protein